MEGQGHALSSLKAELKTTRAEVVTAQNSVGTLRRELGEYLADMRKTLATSEKQLRAQLQRLDTDLTEVSGRATHEAEHATSRANRLEEKLLSVEVDMRVDRKRFQETLEDVKDRQAVLFRTVNAMEAHLGQLAGPERSEGFVTPTPQSSYLPGEWPELPKNLLGDPQERDEAEGSVKDSVMSPPPNHVEQGKIEPQVPVDIKAKVTSGGPQYTMGSVPATMFTAHMSGPGVGTSYSAGGAGGPSGVAGTGVGQMKLDAPPRYAGGRRPRARVWVAQMERYMRLMRYAETDWLDVIAMRVDGAASSWVQATLVAIERGQ